MTSFEQTTAIHLPPLSPSADLLGEATATTAGLQVRGEGPGISAPKHGWTGEEKEDEGILTFPPNKGGTTHRREGGGSSTCWLPGADVNHQPCGTAPT